MIETDDPNSLQQIEHRFLAIGQRRTMRDANAPSQMDDVGNERA